MVAAYLKSGEDITVREDRLLINTPQLFLVFFWKEANGKLLPKKNFSSAWKLTLPSRQQ